MLIKGLIDEDFVNYYKPSMFVILPSCNWKCDKEAGCQVCQNGKLASLPSFDYNIPQLIARYITNPITKALVLGGLEPLDSDELLHLITLFREQSDDDIVIYTGYTEEEIQKQIKQLKGFENIIIKFGRFIPNQEKHYDEILGIELASPNQYARRIS